jgi:octaprenyl-diphosphate synthase
MDSFIYTELKSEIPLINQLVLHILQCGGKRIRPLLVLLSARAFEHQKQHHIDLAAAIELIHTATLLHDDVVDNSSLRRGHETAHTIWGNEASVLVGDFLYSRAFQLIVRTQNLPVINIFSNATNLIAEGEVMQLVNCHDADTSEQSYFQVIERKTAKLFEVATQAGAALATDHNDHMLAMKQYGLHLGIAYQLIDDVLDYSAETEQMGKNKGNDLIEGKPTLPLIYALRNGKPSEIALIRHAIESGSVENFMNIIEIIESTGAIEYTANAAKEYAEKATKILTAIPESPYSRAMHTLAEFVVERSF